MKVLVTKYNGAWAVHHAYGPIVEINVGQIIEHDDPILTDEFKMTLINEGYAELVTDEDTGSDKEDNTENVKEDDNSDEVATDADNTEDTDEDDTPSVGSQLADIVIANPKEKKAKNALETWGKQTLGVDIDRRMSVENIVEALTDEAKRQASEG